MGILKFLALELTSWIVKGYLKVTGRWIGEDDYRSMAADVRRFARVFHLNHYAVILNEGDGKPCSACGHYVCLIVEPHSLCYPCWLEGLKNTQQKLREAVRLQQAQ
jgi:hypothetical protein